MKRILCAVLMAVVLATPAFAAKVYLKEGGVIQAKRVWREGGKVYVLATRHTLTSFENSEVDLKRTFPKKHHVAKKIGAVTPQAQTAAAVPKGTAATLKAEERKAATVQPEKTTDNPVPSSGGGGTIRKYNRAIEEKINE